MPARHRLLAALIALTLSLASCGDPPPTPESDAGKRPSEIQAQAAALDTKALEQTVASYAARVKTIESRLSELQSALRSLDAGQILGPEGARLSKETEQLRRELVSVNRGQRAYTEALAAKR